MRVSIKNKVAFVSGSNRGIGKAITIQLLENGASKVYAGARDIGSLVELKTKYGDRIIPVELDVTKDETIANVAKFASDVEILVNNAGMFSAGNFIEGNLLESLKLNMDVNLWGMVKLTNAFLDTIREKDSAAIVSISSLAGLASMPMGVSYSASKAALHNIIQGIRGELKGSNILVSGVYPGPINKGKPKDGEIIKDNPESVAQNIIKGIQNGEEYIFPDTMSKEVGARYFTSPKLVEEQFSNFI